MDDAPQTLSQQALAQLSLKGINVPAYARDIAPSVVHLGLGAFHRAHQALVFDDLLRGSDERWGVLGVATRSSQLADTLNKQDGLYCVRQADARGEVWRLSGAIFQTCAVLEDPARVMAAIASPATRWLTLTVTEKGYDAALAGVIIKGLALRQQAGLAGLTIASCDNLQHNGDKLKSLCLAAAGDAQLAAWIAAACRFPNSMVDRIVPAAVPRCSEQALAVLGVRDNAALFTESFWQWVIEDNFVDAADGRVLARAGVTVVADVRPYEDAKLRMLNGSHSALACLGVLIGLPTVFDCVSDCNIRCFLYQLMTREVMGNLSRPGLNEYRDELLDRFVNPEVKHGVHQIATDSSQKIGLRWLPSILAQRRAGASFAHHAFAAACWMRYCLGEDEGGNSYAINDPQAPLLRQIAHTHRGSSRATVDAFMQLSTIWGDALGTDAGWKKEVARWHARIASGGAMRALQTLQEESQESASA